jgi:hypothetical protein
MTLFCFHCQVRIKVLADMFRFLGSGRQFDIAGSPGLVEQHLPLSPCTIFHSLTFLRWAAIMFFSSPGVSFGRSKVSVIVLIFPVNLNGTF